MIRFTRRGAVYLACVMALLLCLFAFSVHVRKDYLGKPGGIADGSWKSLNGLTALFADYWLKVPPWKNGFVLNFHPQRPDMALNAYTSYPPGYLVPYYLYLRASGAQASVSSATHTALAAQLFTTLAIALLILVSCASLLPAAERAVLALHAGACCLLLSPALYWWDLWWPDTAALPWFAAFFLFEFFAHGSSRRMVGLGRHALIFAGAYTDWSFSMLIVVYATLRLVDAGRASWRSCLGAYLPGVLMATAVHFTTVAYRDSFRQLFDKILLRLSLRRDPDPEFDFTAILVQQFGWTGIILFVVTLAACAGFYFLPRARAHKSKPIYLLFALSLGITLAAHFLLLRQHHRQHPYPYLRLVLFFSMAVAGWLPALLLSKVKMRSLRFLALAGLTALWGWNAANCLQAFQWHKESAIFLPQGVVKVCAFVRANLPANAILFSRRYGYMSEAEAMEKAGLSEVALSECMAHVYTAATLDDIQLKLKDLQLQPFHLVKQGIRIFYLEDLGYKNPLLRGRTAIIANDQWEMFELPAAKVFQSDPDGASSSDSGISTPFFQSSRN